MLYIINSPLEQFEIQLFLSFYSPFINLNIFDINNFSLFSLFLILFISLIIYITLYNISIVSNKWIVIFEIIYDTILNIIKNIIQGNISGIYFPIIFTFFVIIILANIISLIPYSFALTSSFIFVISISFIVWFGLLILGLYKHGLNFFSLFVPSNTPIILIPLLVIIEILSYIARSISLGLRLAVNNCAGHLLIIIINGLVLNFISINLFCIIISIIPIIAIVSIFILELAIGFIQSYVWTILISSYLKDVLYLH